MSLRAGYSSTAGQNRLGRGRAKKTLSREQGQARNFTIYLAGLWNYRKKNKSNTEYKEIENEKIFEY